MGRYQSPVAAPRQTQEGKTMKPSRSVIYAHVAIEMVIAERMRPMGLNANSPWISCAARM